MFALSLVSGYSIAATFVIVATRFAMPAGDLLILGVIACSLSMGTIFAGLRHRRTA
jgi:hypothetical protein